jgi:hypothetical protein
MVDVVDDGHDRLIQIAKDHAPDTRIPPAENALLDGNRGTSLSNEFLLME